MSLKIMALVWECECSSHTQKLVLLALADNANDDGICWPSITTIANKCSLSRQSVLDQIAILSGGARAQKRHSKATANGTGNRLLEIIESGRGTRNKYRLLVKPVDCLPVKPVDQSSPQTSQADRLPPVKPVDYHQSSPLTEVVKPVDSNRKQPSDEPSDEPSKKKVAGASLKPIHGRAAQLELDAQNANLEPLPLLLDGHDGFKSAWREWCEWRVRCAHHGTPKGTKPPWTVNAARRALAKCERWGAERGVAAIRHSLDRWEDVYEPKDDEDRSRTNGASKHAPTSTTKPLWKEI